jgi:hypothetical protein
MNLTSVIVGILKARGDKGATFRDLQAEELRNLRLTDKQVKKALQNAKSHNLLTMVPGEKMGLTRDTPGRVMGVYFWREPGERPPRKRSPSPPGTFRRKRKAAKPIPSVFAMAEELEMIWPPKFTGGRVYMNLNVEDFA